jgi:hypothetical protein
VSHTLALLTTACRARTVRPLFSSTPTARPSSFTYRLANITRHVTGCHRTQHTRGQIALDDVAGNIWKILATSWVAIELK